MKHENNDYRTAFAKRIATRNKAIIEEFEHLKKLGVPQGRIVARLADQHQLTGQTIRIVLRDCETYLPEMSKYERI